VLTDGNSTTFADVAKMQRRYLGTAEQAPTNGGLKNVYLRLTNYLG
jgi:hypothetical protein